jgi:hypothetical protein
MGLHDDCEISQEGKEKIEEESELVMYIQELQGQVELASDLSAHEA